MNILIIGGETSAWMSAAYMAKQFSLHRHQVDIKVIESPNIPSIGVGESTVPAMVDFFTDLQLAEKDWMPICNASYKMGTKYVNWINAEGNDTFWQPFFNKSHLKLNEFPQGWLQLFLQGRTKSFAESFFESIHICNNLKSPKGSVKLNEIEELIPYAYHIDAVLLSKMLRNYARSLGVSAITGKVIDVSVNDNGFINNILVDSVGLQTANLYVDCSGFDSMLLEKSLYEPWLDYSKYLINDRVIATQIPYNHSVNKIAPYTTATALSAGWSWNIPLQSRLGAGYAYASKFSSSDKAENEFRQHLGQLCKECTMRTIDMKIGRRQRCWVGNCVAIGLSGGFIEPLEATSLLLTQIGIKTLVSSLPGEAFHPVTVNSYNNKMAKTYDAIRDFIVLHYCTNKRFEPYWRHVRQNILIPDSIQEVLELWYYAPDKLSIHEIVPHSIFNNLSYFCVLLGKQVLPKMTSPLYSNTPLASTINMIKKIHQRAEVYNKDLPDLYSYLDRMRTVKLSNLQSKSCV